MTWRRWLRVPAFLFLFVALVAAGLAWLASSEAGLRLLVAGLETASAGRLSVEGVHGRLLGPLRCERLTVRLAEQTLTLGGLDLDWQPRQLLQQRLRVDHLWLDTLRVEQTKPSPEPPQLPASLRVPLALDLQDVRVRRLDVVQGKLSASLGNLRLALEKPAQRYRLSLHRLDSPWAGLTGEMELDEVRPFDLKSRVAIALPDGERIVAAAAGSLGDFALQAQATEPARLQLVARLTPFHPTLPVQEARLVAKDVDPARWRKDWPGARLDAAAEFSVDRSGHLQGRLSADNALAGPLDRQRLPVQHLALRFAGTGESLRFTELRLDLGRGGRFQGQGGLAAGRLEAQLTSRDFDPHAIHTTVRSMALKGTLTLAADARVQRLKLGLSDGRYRLDADVSRRGDDLEIALARLAAAAGRLEASGHLGLAAPRRFDLVGELSDFNPAAFGAYPEARINARLGASGRLLPRPAGDLGFSLGRSHYRNHDLAGSGRLNLTPEHLRDSDVDLALAGNRLQFSGGFGAPGDRLSWRLEARNPQIVSAQLAGRLSGEGTLVGTLAEPAGEFKVSGAGLRWGERYGVATLQAQGRLDQGLDGQMEISGSLEGLKAGDISLTSVEVSGKGRHSGHAVVLRVREREHSLQATLAGAWKDGWSGEITQLDNQGPYPLHLLQPARLDLGRDRVRLQGARFSFLGGRFEVRDLHRVDGELVSQGSVRGLPTAQVLALLPDSVSVEGDLLLGGEWDVRVADSVNGQAAVWRESGDLAAAIQPRVELGLRSLRLDMRAQASRFQAELAASGQRLGELKGRLQTAFTRRDGVWGLARETPVAGNAELDLAELGWLAPLLDKSRSTRFNAQVAAKLELAGSVGQPALSGSLHGDAITLEWPEVGLRLREGKLRADLRQDRLQLTEFVIQGGKGRFAAQGNLSWRTGEPRLALEGKAEQLEVLNRPDRRLVVSGTGQALLEGRAVNLKGALKAERAFIELPRADAVVRSEDVVVLGRPEPPPRSSPFAVNLDLQLDLGEQFVLVGRGMDVQLGGKLRVSAPPRAYPRLAGSVRVVKGRYSAYGQSLQIERGILDFHGPVDNPGLDIVAMRKHQPVEAGVAITGTARMPQARLVSNPSVPDSEKLAWLVLGRGMDTASGSDLDILSAAAGALLSAGQSVSLQTRIAQAAGLDEIGLRGAGGLESTVLSMGKRLSAKAYLSYEQGLSGVDNLLKFNYSLSRRLSVQVQSGREHAVDLLYTFTFD